MIKSRAKAMASSLLR